MSKSITLTIKPDGSTNVDVSGFQDGSCLKATEDLEKALGKVEERKLKPEAERAVVEQKVTAGY